MGSAPAAATPFSSPVPGRLPSIPPGHLPRARRWLTAQLVTGAHVWLVPCRLLRRKNLAEALLLTRWLRPEARLVTTGGDSFAEEENYDRRIARALFTPSLCFLSFEHGFSKPDPHVFQLLTAGLRALGLAPADTHMVGDRDDNDLAPAAARLANLFGEGV